MAPTVLYSATLVDSYSFSKSTLLLKSKGMQDSRALQGPLNNLPAPLAFPPCRHRLSDRTAELLHMTSYMLTLDTQSSQACGLCSFPAFLLPGSDLPPQPHPTR